MSYETSRDDRRRKYYVLMSDPAKREEANRKHRDYKRANIEKVKRMPPIFPETLQ